jgi:spore germination protein YaaH
MNILMKYIPVCAFVVSVLLPVSASAATQSFEVAGWIPYWRTATGTVDALTHIDTLSEIDPFVYTLKLDGTLVDNGHLEADPWLNLITVAQSKKIRVVPSVMTSNGDLLHKLLSNTKSRRALATSIATLVKDKGYDGIDIDFEGKHAGDKKYFSLFLQGLYQRLGDKMLMCTIESRTPTDSRYYGTGIPPDAEIYANDFKQINTYCDRVRIMTYDQQGIDQRLLATAASSSQLYAPVADVAWVEKVMNLVAKDIKKSKLMIGIPTYGYEYDVTAYANNEYIYKILWTFNPGYATQIASQYNVTPMRNSAGEMSLSYTPTSGTSSAPLSNAPQDALLAAAAISQVATAQNTHGTFRLLDWSDAGAIQDKVNLAKRLGLRGVSIFKIDGGEDPNMWNILQGVKK